MATFLLIALAVLALGAAGGARPSSGGNPNLGGGGVSNKSILWNDLQSIPELTPTQRYFLMLTAYGETGGSFSPRAHNDTASEVLASQNALNNSASLRARLQRCGSPQSWAVGSVGLFQRLAPYFGDDMLDIFGENQCTHVRPDLAYDRAHAIISAIKNARTLQSNYPAFKAKPTVGTLRLGWYGPGAMKLPQDEARLNRYRDHAQKTWGDALPGFVDRPIEVFPGNYRQIFDRLKAGGGAAPSESPLQLLSLAQRPDAYIDRWTTTDEGFTTIDWFSYRGLFMRIDTKLGTPPTQRWVVFGNPLHVLAIGEVATTSSVEAAKAAAAWVDVFKGGPVS